MKSSELIQALNAVPEEFVEQAAPNSAGLPTQPDISEVLTRIREEGSTAPVMLTQQKHSKRLPILISLASAAACFAVIGVLIHAGRKTNEFSVQNSNNQEIEAVEATITDLTQTNALRTTTTTTAAIITDEATVSSAITESSDSPVVYNGAYTTPDGELVVGMEPYVPPTTESTTTAANRPITTTTTANPFSEQKLPDLPFAFVMRIPQSVYDAKIHYEDARTWVFNTKTAAENPANLPKTAQQYAGWKHLTANADAYDVLWYYTKPNAWQQIPEVRKLTVSSTGRLAISYTLFTADMSSDEGYCVVVVPVPKKTLPKITSWKQEVIGVAAESGKVPEISIKTAKMTLSDVKQLAKKGSALSWADLEPYDFERDLETPHVLHYLIDENYQLDVVGTTEQSAAPTEARLHYLHFYDNGVNIMEEDPTDYIEKRQMTIDDVLRLSEKGMSLSWSDLSCYACKDIGSGFVVLEYTLTDANYRLIAGCPDMEGAGPSYARLEYIPDGSRVEIRTENVQEFLKKHTQTAK